MKLAELYIDMFLNGLVNFFDEGAGLANEEDFFILVIGDPFNQPFDLLLESRAILGRWIQGMKHGLALGEAF